MTPADILESAAFDGIALTLADDGKLRCTGDPKAVKQWTPILREHKIELLAQLQSGKRHNKVLAMLDGSKYAVLCEDASTDPVLVTAGIRGIATFELAIPKHSYDGLILLELLEAHSNERTTT